MFKCKIDLSEFDKNEKKIPNVELNQARALSKAAVKKLAGGNGEKTSFFLVKDYFENNGKAIGNFLAIGESKKMAKHFLMNELKGKKDVAMAKDAKSASMGEVYVKEIAGKNVLHFEPHEKCKLPSGQWPKVLKALKGFFGGMKAVLVLAGQLIEAEEGGEEGEEVSSEAAYSTSDSKETVASPTTPVLDQIKELIKTISESFKNEISTAVIQNIKSKIVSNKDLDISVTLLDKIAELQKLYDGAEEKIKKGLQPHVEKIVSLSPKLNQIKDAIIKIMGASPSAASDNVSAEEIAAMEKLIKEGKEYLSKFQKNMGSLQDDISKVASETIAGGKELLGKLF